MSPLAKVLLVGPRPRNLADLNTKSEIRAILARVGQVGRQIDLIEELGVEFGDLAGLLFKHKPEILHITAHGSKDGYLAFETIRGETHAVPIDSLQRLLRTYAQKGTLRCIVFNSCHMGDLAESLTDFVEYVIASPRDLLNKAGIAFSEIFYQMLSLNEPIETCFEIAISNSTAVGGEDGEYKLYFRSKSEGPARNENRPLLPDYFSRFEKPASKKPLIFINSVPKDEKYIKELTKRLKPLADRGILEYWAKSMMMGGSIRTEVLAEKLGKADLILLCGSADALADDEWNKLMERAMVRFRQKAAQVVPLRLRPISFDATPFEHLEGLPADGKAVSSHLQSGREEVWIGLVDALLELLKPPKN